MYEIYKMRINVVLCSIFHFRNCWKDFD